MLAPMSAFRRRFGLQRGRAGKLRLQADPVCPLLVDLEEYHRPPDKPTLERLRKRRERAAAAMALRGPCGPEQVPARRGRGLRRVPPRLRPRRPPDARGRRDVVQYLRALEQSGRRAGAGRQRRIASTGSAPSSCWPIGPWRTCSSASPSTRASASPFWRRWSSACRWWRTPPPPSPKPWGGPGSWSKTKTR